MAPQAPSGYEFSMIGDDAHATGAGLLRRINASLSAKLLVLTIAFVLIAELFVLIPSISKRRIDWFQQRIESAYLVGLALEAPKAEMLDEVTVGQLFATANIIGVTVSRDGARMQILAPRLSGAAPPMRYIDLTKSHYMLEIGAAWAAFFSRGDDMVRVIGEPEYLPGGEVDIIVSGQALRSDLIAYARNILWVSLAISALTALFLFGAINFSIVRPVQRLSRNMTAFQAAPEESSAIIAPSLRKDEIGIAERSLEALERRIQELLAQRRRLAALGAGISKISHDLRNILASAQLMSDRLAKSDDPRVQKLSPRLLQALDRAITLSKDTLNYGRMEPSALSKSRFKLHALIDEVFDDAASLHVVLRNDAPADLHLTADRNQLYRALFNLVKNAVEAILSKAAPDADMQSTEILGHVTIAADAAQDGARIRITDDGPGLPPAAIENLFEPFRGSAKPGGSGLGVAIAYEIVRAHGGTLALEKTGPDGATFLLRLP